MWKVVVIVCALGNPCVMMEESPMQHYKKYDDCIKVAEDKHKQIVDQFWIYGYHVEHSQFTCETTGPSKGDGKI